MSKLETNTIDTVSGTTNLTIGSTNTSTITLPSGEVTGHMYPAWSATISTDQSMTNGVTVKVNFDYEILDTDSAYDATTNYRFTVPSGKAGKYFVIARLSVKSSSSTGLGDGRTLLYKNGSTYSFAQFDTGSGAERVAVTNAEIIDLAVGDYVEVYSVITSSSGTLSLDYTGTGQGDLRCSFHGYRIGA